MAEVIDYGVARGSFRTAEPDRVVAVLSALTDGFSVQLTLGSDAVTRPELIDIVMGVAHDLLRVGS